MVTTPNDESKTVYILLPYYRRGNLQDGINKNLVEKNWWDEKWILEVILGVCEGLALMHGYRVKAPVVRGQAQGAQEDGEEGLALMDGEGDGVSGGAVGELRPWAHRDIKPGTFPTMLRKIAEGANVV